MNKKRKKDDIQYIERLREGGLSADGIAVLIGCSVSEVQAILDRANGKPSATSEEPAEEPTGLPPMGGPIPDEINDLERKLREAEEENARLLQQLTWAEHSEPESRTGGLLTLRRSDDHHGDKNHLLSCSASLEAKFCTMVEQYEPERIQLIAGDDWIVGNGIYKEQDLDSATSDVDEQLAIGAMKARKFISSIRSVTEAPITWRVLRGNHEHTRGLSVARDMFMHLRLVTEDIAGVKWVFHGDSITANLAHTGTYNVLIKHGFGYSKHSPNSPAFIEATKDELLVKQRNMMPHEQYRRVLSGHTHWLSIGLERVNGLFWDTTGGLQRNTRIRLGANQRPPGWIVYVGPAGMENEILNPVGLSPSAEALERELENENLDSLNMRDCAECVSDFRALMVEWGVFGDPSSFGKTNDGRY
jgi:hypothetical protein